MARSCFESGGGGGEWGLNSDSKLGAENTFFLVTLYNFHESVCVSLRGLKYGHVYIIAN